MFKNKDQYVEDITTQVNTYIENEEWMSGFKYLEKMIVDLDLVENTQIIGFIERVRREESL